MQFPSKTGRIALASFLAAAIVLSSRAVEPDKYIPSDAEAVIVLNVQQLLNSPLVKKYGTDELKKQIQNNDDIKKFMAATGLDPLKDIHKIVIGLPVGDLNPANPKFVAAVHGKFDVEKIEAAVT